MRKLFWILLLFIGCASEAQVSDATLTTKSNQVKNESLTGANSANRVGTLFLDITNSKGNKQEANTWTALQTFTATSTTAGLRLGVVAGSDPSSPSDGQMYHNSTSDKPRYYDGTWRYITLNDGINDTRVQFGTSGRLTDDADLTFSGTTLTVTNVSLTGSASEAGIRLANLGADPSTPLQGEMISHTTADLIRYYNGSAWQYLVGSESGLTSTRVPFAANATGSGFVLTDDADFTFTGGNTLNITNLVISGTCTGCGSGGSLTFENLGSDPGSPGQGRVYENTVTDMVRVYNGAAWQYLVQSESGLTSTRVPFTTNATGAGFTLTDDADFTFTGGNTLNVTNIIAGSGTPVTSGSVFTSNITGSAASGNVIAAAMNVRQTVATTGVQFAHYVKAYAEHASGTVNQMLAIQGNAENAGAGTVTNLRGILGGTVTTNGPVTNAIGVKAEGIFIAGSASITNSYGILISGATIGSGSVTNDFGLYQSGNTVRNVFEGSVTFSTSATDAGVTVGLRASDPSSPTQGGIYSNTTTDMIRYYNGAAWQYLVQSESGLNSGRVAFSTNATGAGFTLTDDADMTFSGSTLTVTNIVATSLSANALSANLENLGSDPGGPIQGRVYSNTTTDMIRYYNGSVWQYIAQSESGLNSGRVPYTVNATGAGFTLTDDADFTFDGTTVTATTATIGTLRANALNSSGVVYSGTYTPTITAVSANIDATTSFVAQYFRIGNVVTISGQVDVDANTAGGATTRIRLSLPVSTNFANPNEAGGAGKMIGVTPGDVAAYADTANEEVILHWQSGSTSNQSMSFVFTYRII